MEESSAATNKTYPSKTTTINLDPFDNPYIQILQLPFWFHPLNGDNYGTWMRAMKMTIRAKNKLGFVDGTIPMHATTSENYSKWIRINDMVTSWLLHSIIPDIASNVIYSESASKIWSDLPNRFPQPKTTNVY
ncbi:UBN2_3 domain-containing protein [Cephalotus follicularis]|uniref:UBN2_3 domain-containing protein n=1 Tax=Cephalotus follicularis TaxID=3775 RepID=A0A1Q3CIK3_CEPFO|nr:UBN2_3 domain-containing protein [Cephalotus follicularis]